MHCYTFGFVACRHDTARRVPLLSVAADLAYALPLVACMCTVYTQMLDPEQSVTLGKQTFYLGMFALSRARHGA